MLEIFLLLSGYLLCSSSQRECDPAMSDIGWEPSRHQRSAALCLIRRGTSVLPEGFQIGGVAEGSEELLLWSVDAQPTILSVAATGMHDLLVHNRILPNGHRILTARETSVGWELLVGAPFLYSTYLNGLYGLRPFAPQIRADAILAAASTADRWILLDTAAVPRLHVYTDQRFTRVTLDAGRIILPLTTTPSLRTVLFAEQRPPFAIHEFHPDEGAWVTYRAELESSLPTREQPSSSWRALRILRLNSDTWLQTIADLRSDFRVLARRDARGQVISTRVFHQPIAFVASFPRNRVLYAVRELGTADELISFTWHWTQDRDCDDREVPGQRHSPP